jgi:hypothetical protein
MDILIAILLILILLGLLLVCWILTAIEKYLSTLKIEEPKPEEGSFVTDPFQRPKETYTSTSSIIIPKTPTEIRNQNFRKIQEGIEYGDIRRD